jgi:hypothetical protein
MHAIKDLQWQNKPLSAWFVVPITGDLQAWGDDHGQIWKVIDPATGDEVPNVGWIWSESQGSIVAAIFNQRDWVPNRATAWLSTVLDKAGMAVTLSVMHNKYGAANPHAASFEYLRRYIMNLRQHVPPEVDSQCQLEARAYAGGVLKGKNITDSPAEENADLEPNASDDPAHTPEPELVPEGSASSPATALALSTKRKPFAVAQFDMTADPLRPYVEVMTFGGQEIDVIWKCVARVGLVWRDKDEPARITSEMIDGCIDSFGKAIEHVDIPVGHEWDAPMVNTGYVRKLERRGNQLWAALQFTDPVAKEKVMNGSVANVSCWFEPNYQDQNMADKIWPWTLAHVCLTNKPLMTGLGSFANRPRTITVGKQVAALYATEPRRQNMAGAAAPQTNADGTPVDPQVFKSGSFKQGDMVQVSQPHDLAAQGETYFIGEAKNGNFVSLLTAAGDVLKWFDEAELQVAEAPQPNQQPQGQQPQGASRTSPNDEQMLAFMRQKFGTTPEEITSMKVAFARQATKNRSSRKQEVKLALEGKLEVEGITYRPGFRHATAVVTAVLDAMDKLPSTAKFAVDHEGTCALDAILFGVLNEIPNEQMVRDNANQFTAPRRESNVLDGNRQQNAGVYTQEEIKAFSDTYK